MSRNSDDRFGGTNYMVLACVAVVFIAFTCTLGYVYFTELPETGVNNTTIDIINTTVIDIINTTEVLLNESVANDTIMLNTSDVIDYDILNLTVNETIFNDTLEVIVANVTNVVENYTNSIEV